ncbi:MAG: DUF927 domain-containing protein [Porcipelethomonas sp.]
MIDITQEQIDAVTFEDTETEAITGIIEHIAYFDESNQERRETLTKLRRKAAECDRLRDFDCALFNFKACSCEYLAQNHIDMSYDYCLDDYMTTAPYEEIFRYSDPFERTVQLEHAAKKAKKAGFTSFKKAYNNYVKSLKLVKIKSAENINITHPTDFPQQPLELESGTWECDADGVIRHLGTGAEEVACLHPIMPVERLVNIDTGEEKLKIAYFKGRYWREIIVGKKELFDASKIIQLAAVGVSVTSKSARLLSEFLCDIEALNYDSLPERESVSRLGYIGDGKSFSPYVDGVIFDGDANYSTIYNAIKEHGDFSRWHETAVRCRSESITAQIMLAASFASVLIKKIGGLCFFVHLWGIESGTGKTVALMLAASVWGDPEIGRYIQTFNATQVGHEKTAAFLNNIPMCIDELQLSKDSHGRSKFDVYQLSQGVGRTRGTKTGGIDKPPSWNLCILTTGESPLTSDNSGAGAVNRVIDIECRAKDAVIRDGIGTSRIVKQNYGYAGKMFVESLTDEVISEARDIYERLFRELLSGSTTEKQAMAAAMLLTADQLADRFVFKTGKHLTVSQISDFLKSKASVSAGERGYSYMCDWVAMNSNRFKSSNENSDVYGLIQEDWAYINGAVFRKAAKDAGFDDRALLSWLKTNGLILTRGRRFTRGKRINGVNVECVVMKLPSGGDEGIADEDYSDML